jgi:hypothetical protein
MGAARRKVPQRTCITCQEVKPKKDLIRIVRTPENEVELDLEGKRSGRGAYVCRRPECVQGAFSKNVLDRALRFSVSDESKQTLRRKLEEELERQRREEIKRQLGPVREPEEGV